MSSLPRLAQVPPGVQCFLGDEARRRRAIVKGVQDPVVARSLYAKYVGA